MKVMFLFGGVPLYLDALLKRLSADGAKITVVVPRDKSSVLGKGVKTTDAVQYAYDVIEAEEKQSVVGKPYFKDLPNIINDVKPDIVVAGWPYFLAYMFQRKLRKAMTRHNVRFVVREIPFQVPPYDKVAEYFRDNPMTDEDMNVLSSGFPFFVRQHVLMHIRKYCYSNADGALAYSSHGLDIMPTYGIGRERVFVTYNSGDTDALMHQKLMQRDEQAVLPASDARIIHIGRLVKWKRVDLLLDAFSKVVKDVPEAELVIVGGGPELERLKQQARDMGMENRVVFTGALYNAEQVGSYMMASSLYVLAGMGGLSINDAMTYGLPVVCSVCDSTERDLVTNGVNGFFFREGDAADLAEKITTILKNDSLRREMGIASLSIIENKININTVSSRYIDAFGKIMALPKRSRS